MKPKALRSMSVLANGRWLRASLLLAWPLLLVESASAQTFWVADGVGNWYVAANWSNGLPGANAAQINNGGTARLFDPGASAQSISLGESSGSSGSLEVIGGGRVNSGLDLHVGFGGTGVLRILNGGGVDVNDFGVIGTQVTGVGAVFVDGTGSSWTNFRAVEVGDRGTGTLNITAGGAVENNDGLIGNLLGSTGTVAVDGVNSTWTNRGELNVGREGAGTLNITGAGAVSNTNGYIGRLADSTGTVTVDGAGSQGGSVWTNSGELNVGYEGTGALNIQNGGKVSNTMGVIGRAEDSSGMVTVASALSEWANFGDLSVGLAGAGALSITGGIVSNGNANIGNLANSSGAVTVDGPNSVWINSSVLAVGSSGMGMLSITGAGRVTSTNGRISRSAGSTGTVLIDGPGSQWNASGAFTMGQFGTGASTLTVQNGGQLDAAGGMTIGPLGTVRGDGTIAANVQNTTGVIAPSGTGASLGTLQIFGNYTQSFGGTLQIELASPASFDKLVVTGNITLPSGSIAGGGTLHVSLAGGYVPQGSQSFDILDWGSRSGGFDSVVLPTLGGTLTWDASQLYTTGVLSVVGPPAPAFAADFDEDGDVDGDDLAQWQGDFGVNSMSDADNDGDSDGADFLVWQRQLGSVATVAATGAIPEPGTLILLVSGVLALYFRRSVAVS